MIYKSSVGDIDLTNLVRLYPAVVVDMQGEVAEMSLEWIELYGDKVKTLHYVLVFDSTQIGDEEKNRVVLTFETKDELMQEMQEVAKLYN
ncbi:hypothetical protein [Sulfurimonas marina]|uniref:Uncharacterized protein n=1 Tax=Sulfurimonas marina TaxID=2590551 RepID=A0A7M1AX38_9BACT|nr:hypothetical protein [Sulfurimonas marina]QOP40932.1 hypothetical protein FJR03_03920 [Sulfurimonas marina]